MAKHAWSEEGWEGTMSSDYRHCLMCKAFKTPQNQNEECLGAQAPPAIQVLQADAPPGATRLAFEKRLSEVRNWAIPPQSIPDDVLLADLARRFARDVVSFGLSGEQVQDLLWKAYLHAVGVPYKGMTEEEAVKRWEGDDRIRLRQDIAYWAASNARQVYQQRINKLVPKLLQCLISMQHSECPKEEITVVLKELCPSLDFTSELKEFDTATGVEDSRYL